MVTNRSKLLQTVTGDKWGDFVCEKLNCGKLKEPVDVRMMTTSKLQPSSVKVKTMCTDDENHPWQCARKKDFCTRPAAIICSGKSLSHFFSCLCNSGPLVSVN
ncbi:hypothetical protein N1851_012109 [Merluccius polli]|uniref:Uncharacterized protein n=1 Tax=Merluccius polli TaxID=89951 RepID=A0AA47P4N0_MERPO|nr:hypothetical protein N1851_030112 [Merluccius polli]KAK0148175.1 hypothetical protein N1851_012109 [Merluccius polli]